MTEVVDIQVTDFYDRDKPENRLFSRNILLTQINYWRG